MKIVIEIEWPDTLCKPSEQLELIENALSDVTDRVKVIDRTEEFAAARSACEAASSVASEEAVELELRCYNMGNELIDRLGRWCAVAKP